jgi:hypothetical protein
MRLSKEMIKRIESIHSMDKNELYETYGEMIPRMRRKIQTKLNWN